VRGAPRAVGVATVRKVDLTNDFAEIERRCQLLLLLLLLLLSLLRDGSVIAARADRHPSAALRRTPHRREDQT
jgi:hypothetical protein